MNLLLKKEKSIVQKGLKLRFLITASILLGAAFVVGMVMLLPSYFLAKSVMVNTGPQSYSGEEPWIEEMLELPLTINNKLQFFRVHGRQIAASTAIMDMAEHRTAGIFLNAISFERQGVWQEKAGILVKISGVASSRSNLIDFEAALNNSEMFSAVSLPVSDLAKDRNLPFSVTLFIAN